MGRLRKLCAQVIYGSRVRHTTDFATSYKTHTKQLLLSCSSFPPTISSPYVSCVAAYMKLNYRKPMTETFFTDAEGKIPHIKSRVSPPSPSLSLITFFFPFDLKAFQMRDSSYTCPMARNHVNASLVLRLNKMIHFSITAMSV